MMDPKTRTWCKEPIAKTEMILNKLDCDFVKSIIIDYRFESVQPLRFTVVDVDNQNNPSWTAQELIGHFDTEVGKIVGSRGRTLAGRLEHPQHRKSHRGTVIISAEEQSQSKKVIQFNIEATKLVKKGLFRSEPNSFFVIHRASENGVFAPIYQSPVVRSKINPIWAEFSIKEINLCNGDPDRQLKIEVKKFKENGPEHVTIGVTPVFTFQSLMSTQFPKSFPLSPMPAGTDLLIRRMIVTEPPSFLDYLAGGIPLNLVVAIDFTQSNGDPRHPQSLHFKNPSGENDYTRAIRSVGNILQCYDTDKKFPVYGFGGKVNGQVSHCFALNGNPQFPEVDGVDGILAAYWHALQFAELYGPTNFSPVINQTAAICNQHRSGTEEYYVLLILTDGVITDMDNTIRAIIGASRLPLSIIIVGVGSANFDNMNVLDADDEPLRANGVTMARDIVQFVPFRDFQAGAFGNEALAEAVLAEVPDQFVSYMTQQRIVPRPPPRADTMQAMTNGGVTYDRPVSVVSVPSQFPPAGSPVATHYAPPSGSPISHNQLNYRSSVASIPSSRTSLSSPPAGRNSLSGPSISRSPQAIYGDQSNPHVQPVQYNQYGQQIQPNQYYPQGKN
ncbi:Copine-8 [Entomortierella beljakovae]|nr:Copine-8 [Entomortierella beljakovae]